MKSSIALYGIEPVIQCLTHSSRDVSRLILKENNDSERLRSIARLGKAHKIPLETASPQKLESLCKSKNHQGVVLFCGEKKTLDLKSFIKDDTRDFSLIIALDQIEDPQNLGAVIRSASYFGAAGLLYVKRKNAPLSPTVSKVSAGALENFPVIEVNNLAQGLSSLKQNGYFIVGADTRDGEGFQKIIDLEKMALVLGNEGQGLRELTRSHCDFLVTIEGGKTTESLNVSNAAAILIQHFTKPKS
ncbi:MAG: 23S rRNA (guanosine(2251)-2'-O)-methyltransferase RlmB [Deltaproteobacteria bacterium]|nr:23S rRNA (guanosine(2251)-2'-O)-methyltransferase RlmB [Deltaproteobacteria bacterium]